MIVNDNVVKVKYSQTLGKTGVRTEEEVKNIVLKNESLKHISPKQLFEQKQDESKVNALISEFEKKMVKFPQKESAKHKVATVLEMLKILVWISTIQKMLVHYFTKIDEKMKIF